MPSVRGEILGDARLPEPAGVLKIYLEDVTHVDAPARVVAAYEHRPTQLPWQFELSVAAVDPKRHYAVRAHLDMDGSGTVSPGDWITTESHPVLTFDQPTYVSLRLRSIPPSR